MSPKSRPPKDKKGKKRKKNKEVTTVLIEESATGPPFGIIVLIATVMSIPAIIQFVDGQMAFDAAVLRYLAALAVAWILVHLVYAVAHSFGEERTTTTIEENFTGPGGAEEYRTAPGSGYGGFNPTIEGNPVEDSSRRPGG